MSEVENNKVNAFPNKRVLFSFALWFLFGLLSGALIYCVLLPVLFMGISNVIAIICANIAQMFGFSKEKVYRNFLLSFVYFSYLLLFLFILAFYKVFF
jgi:hypothetical protein